MEIPAPRRPRRWSSACSGTLARLLVGVVLLALVAWPERHRRVRQVQPLTAVPALDALDALDEFDDDRLDPVLRRLNVALRRIQMENRKWILEQRELLSSTATSRGAYLVTAPPSVAALMPHSRMYEAEFDPLEAELAALLVQLSVSVSRTTDEPVEPDPAYRTFMYRDAGLHVLLDVIRDVIDG